MSWSDDEKRALFDHLQAIIGRLDMLCGVVGDATRPEAVIEQAKIVAREIEREMDDRDAAPVLEIVREADAPVAREHEGSSSFELVKIDGIPLETYPLLPTDADTNPIDVEDR